MSSIRIGNRIVANSFILAISFSMPLAALAQENVNLPDDSGKQLTEIARGDRGGGGRAGGARGGGGARVSRPSGGAARSALGSRSSGKLRSSIGNKPSLRSGGLSQARPGQRGQSIQHPAVGMRGSTSTVRQQPSSPVVRPGQRPSTGQRPSIGQQPASSRRDAGASQLPSQRQMRPGAGQLPSQRPLPPGNRPERPNRPSNISQINAPRSVNVEGYDGGWGYQGEDYPWGLGAAAGMAGFTLGSVLNAIPSNSQPVVIQGQPYYESDGMYFAPSEGGGLHGSTTSSWSNRGRASQWCKAC